MTAEETIVSPQFYFRLLLFSPVSSSLLFDSLWYLVFGKGTKEGQRRRTGKADTGVLLCFQDIEQADQETRMILDLKATKQKSALASEAQLERKSDKKIFVPIPRAFE